MANNRSKTVNIPVTFLTFVIVAALFAVASYRVNIDFDILNSLPVTGPVLSDAKYVISHHPFQDRIVIDISHQKVNPEVLANGADFLESRLKDSGLFEQVGIKQTQHLIPELLSHVVSHPQVMFTEEELNRKIKPLLTRERINGQLEETLVSLSNIEGIGQARMIAADPLGFRNIALEKLAHLAPIKGAGIYKGYPISPDNAHMLIIVNPKASGTDTSFSRQITHLFESVSKDLNEKFAGSGYQFTLTPVGGYRAALDNENIVKKDTQRAILFATLGIALLLIVSFPRPLIGLLALVPAFIGTIGAFFVCSFLYDSISILAIGFGGAIISITVDHSIAYLLFLDRPRQMKVSEAAGEVRSIGLIAMLTTVGAFLTLSISGFPVLLQIGQFAALGILFSFVFVHTVFPLMNPVMPPAKKNQVPILRRFVNWMSSKGQNQKAFLALAFAVLMMFFAKLDFNSDLQSMNTISKATSDAEALIGKTWGNVFTRIFLLVEGETVADLQKQGDKLTKMLATDAKAEIIS
ncbi:MMPL family protein, partial [bacterium]|nr:MMPL family protein [bacterium]